MKIPELVAPAGNAACFFAAIENGADAVYCGLDLFSARSRAQNFTLSQMDHLISCAHSTGKKVYAALNTLIRCNEIQKFAEYLLELESMSIDGLILQDLGMAFFIKKHFPKLPIHASTQLAVHNLQGVLTASEIGFKRVVLSRELSLPEIQEIVSKSPIEIEVFVHGALCYSYSGLCLFSALKYNASANRGMCRQPCRRLYKHQGKQQYYFSLQDLQTLDLIEKIAASGVAALKIEGRMRGYNYVSSVTAAYRKRLDNIADKQHQAINILQSRKFTHGFIGGATDSDIFQKQHVPMTGSPAGTVIGVQGGYIHLRLLVGLQTGDRLGIYNKSTDRSHTFVLTQLFSQKKHIFKASSNEEIRIKCPYYAEKGDVVYLVEIAQDAGISPEAALRRLAAFSLASNHIHLKIDFEPLKNRIVMQANGAGWTARCFVNCSYQEAKGSGLTVEIIERHFLLKQPDGFRITTIKTNKLPTQSYISPAFFKNALRELGKTCLSALQEHKQDILGIVCSIQSPVDKSFVELPPDCLNIFQAANIDEAERLAESGHPVWMEMNESLWHEVLTRKIHQNVIVVLEPITHDREYPLLIRNIEVLLKQGHRKFGLSNISHLTLFKDKAVICYSDFRLYCSNPYTACLLSQYDVQHIVLNIEDPVENIIKLLRHWEFSFILPAHMTIPLFYSRLDPDIKGVITDRENNKYFVTKSGSITILLSEIDHSNEYAGLIQYPWIITKV